MRIGTVERAFELAQSGKCSNIQEIAARLKKENFDTVEAHLGGPFIKQQLKAAMPKA